MPPCSAAEQAQERRLGIPDGDFKPFFDGDRVALYIAPEVIALLAGIGTTVDTHIDFELRADRPNWWEQDA